MLISFLFVFVFNVVSHLNNDEGETPSHFERDLRERHELSPGNSSRRRRYANLTIVSPVPAKLAIGEEFTLFTLVCLLTIVRREEF